MFTGQIHTTKDWWIKISCELPRQATKRTVSKAATTLPRPWLADRDTPRIVNCIAMHFISTLAATSNNVQPILNRARGWATNKQRSINFHAFQIDNWLRGTLSRPPGANCRATIVEDASVKLELFADIPPSVFHPSCERTCASVKRFSLLQRTTLEMLIERYRRTYKTVFGKRSSYFIPKFFCDVNFNLKVNFPGVKYAFKCD